MRIYICQLCGYEYNAAENDEEDLVEKGIDFEDLADDWTCPLCGASKDDFELISDDDDN